MSGGEAQHLMKPKVCEPSNHPHPCHGLRLALWIITGAKVKPSRVPQGVEESCLPVVGKTVASAGDDSGSASLPTEPLLPLETAKQILCSIRKRHLRRVPPQIASFPDIAREI